MVFLDSASTTYPVFTKATLNYIDKDVWLNANAPYSSKAKAWLKRSERIVKSTLGTEKGSVYFIGNATQCFQALLQAVYHAEDVYDEWFYFLKSPYEHSCITGGYIEDLVNLTDADFLRDFHKEGKLLVTCQLVNNLTGDILPVKEIAKAAHETHNFLVCDATAAVGKVTIDYDLVENCDALFCSAHKFHGEKGQGFLWISDRLKEVIGDVEYNGTPDPHGAFVTAFAFNKYNKYDINSKTDWDEYFESKLMDMGINYRNVYIKGLKDYTPSIACYLLEDIGSADALQAFLADRDIYIGVGHSSCEDDESRYRVLNAMGLSDKEAEKCIRLSYDGNINKTTEKDIDELCEGICDFIKAYCIVGDYNGNC